MRVTHVEEARMRGDDRHQAGMWSYISPEQRVPSDHPLRPIPARVDAILTELSPEFAKLYSPVGLEDLVAKSDSPPVANWKRAGAVIVGRTNTPVFSLRWHTDNELRGRTVNPWARERTPGGSSGRERSGTR
jgi:hypothetical protein